jgi:AraC-like DNA-binding protein
MAKTAPKTSESPTKELIEKLAILIAKFAPVVGENQTAIPGLSLFRRTDTTACYRGFYEPSLNVFAQGRKNIKLGGTPYQCGAGSFLLSSIDVPVESQIVEASEAKPLLSMLLRLDMSVVREILTHEELPDAQRPSGMGLSTGEATSELLEVCCRIVRLLDTPKDIPFMSRLMHREVVYRILLTPQGERLRSIATTNDLSHRAARAISWLRANYAQPLRIEELADVARMAVSTLHHQFRALTSMSPLQYQKQLRLQAARQRMLMDGLDATSAAYEVGYESVSQFTREYSRLFGQPPLRDIKTLRDAKVVAINAA